MIGVSYLFGVMFLRLGPCRRTVRIFSWAAEAVYSEKFCQCPNFWGKLQLYRLKFVKISLKIK